MPTDATRPDDRPAVSRGRRQAGSVALALGAGLGWASYYVFVLWGTPQTAPSAVLVYPFVVGGAAFAATAVVTGRGGAMARLFTEPGAWLRVALMLATQLSVLAATYLAGPVDAALLSLIGDVVVTPLIAATLFVGPRRSLGRAGFVAGLALSLVGGTVAIAGGHRLSGVAGAGWLAVAGAPLAVGLYFLLSGYANEGRPPVAVVGQSILGAAIGAVAIAPLIPGGWLGLVAIDPRTFGLAAVNGLVSFYVAPRLYFAAIRREGVVIPSVLMTSIPIFTLALAVGVLHEGAAWLALLGIPVAIVGSVITLRGPSGPDAERWQRVGR